MEEINGLKIKPIKITCRTCRGAKQVYMDNTQPESKIGWSMMTHPASQSLFDCPTCKGEGYTEVKRL